MMDLLWSLLGYLVPGAGVVGAAGFVVKLLARLGLKSAGALAGLPLIGTLFEFALRIAEKVADVLVWILKAVLTWLGGGANHISKSPPAAALLLIVTALAWNFGPGDWRFWVRSIEPPAVAANAPPIPTRASQCDDILSACFWRGVLN